MNGGLTGADIEILKAKARAWDAALDYLEGRCDSEQLLNTRRLLLEGVDLAVSA